ncbi:hypothetical protein [Streptomyces sp. NPDC014734]|uniref:hypothetical protein n=1 Tax=Streptomyces sp. NPDC014734 TaxID=3364886 RepID=UPI0037026F9B
MGWTVLYTAFGIVALWLLGEVLLQYKARLRWRLLAFAGFLCVVVGVLMSSRFVIAFGAIAFATGQTYVTLSFRRGFSTGWAIGGSPGASRRRRGGSGRDGRRKEPALQVSELETEDHGQGPEQAAAKPSAAPVHEPQPLPDDTGQYGVYSGHRRAAEGGEGPHGQPQPQYAAYDARTDPAGYPADAHTAPAGHPAQGHDPYGGHDAFSTAPQGFPDGSQGGQNSFAGPYDYGTDGQQYAAYSDPYVGTGTGGGASYDNGYSSGNGYDAFGGQQYAAEPYAQQQYNETPPGGVWVPQQREGEQYPPAPPEQSARPAPFPNAYNNGSGYDEQPYR